MSESPDDIRADIARTRRELSGDVDALADKVSPSKIVDRQTDKLKGALGSVRERVMGSDDDPYGGSSSGEQLGDMKDRAVAKAEGNPLAVGLMAFGAGLLLASLIPPSSKERKIAAEVKDQAQPLVDEATDVAKDVGARLKEPAQAAATAVKESAAESVDTVREEAQSGATEVKNQAQQARDTVADS